MKESIYDFKKYNHVRFAYLVASFILIFSYLITLYANNRSLRQAYLVDQTNKTITSLTTILSDIIDGETGVSGYMNMKDASFLSPYYTSKTRVDSNLHVLKNEISGGIQTERLDTLQRLIQMKFDLLAQTIDLFRGNYGSLTDSLKVKISEGRNSMNLIRRLIFRMQMIEDMVLSEKKSEMQSRFRSHNILIMLSLVIVFALVLFGFLIYRRENNARQKADSRIENFQKTFLQSTIEIQERTFQNIAENIHDNIGQVLTLAKLNLATMDTSGSPVLHEKVQDAKLLVGKAIQDLRNLSHSISADFITQTGLSGAIQYELNLIGKSGLFQTKFSMNGNECRLSKQKELIVFRIVQEVLNNIIKRADANEIDVTINFYADSVNLLISDNGKGFNAGDTIEARSTPFSLGMKNMHKRASIIKSAFQISSSPGNGTIVTIGIPCKD